MKEESKFIYLVIVTLNTPKPRPCHFPVLQEFMDEGGIWKVKNGNDRET